MKSAIFLPNKINVGFNRRDDTYTKKLAYIIYYDEKGKLRKETSWDSWRDKNIPNEIFENIPTSGFVLNKKAGGYSTGWNHRQTYCRVYDPRGFEFEITIPNLLYILENSTSTKGKGLEGEFVYGWEGKDLILVPCESPDYKELVKYNDKKRERKAFKETDMTIGHTYLSSTNEDLVYLGRFLKRNSDDKENKHYFFINTKAISKYSKGIVEFKTLTGNILDETSNNCVENYAELLDVLMNSDYISTRDGTKDEYKYYTMEEFENKINEGYYSSAVFSDKYKKKSKVFIERIPNYSYMYYNRNTEQKYYVKLKQSRNYERLLKDSTIGELFKELKPMYLVSYDNTGKLIREWK